MLCYFEKTVSILIKGQDQCSGCSLIFLKSSTILYVTSCMDGCFLLGTIIMGGAKLEIEGDIIHAFLTLSFLFLSRCDVKGVVCMVFDKKA